MSDYIPPDVLVEIFLRLPVKSLLRFTCVCKSWYFLISHPSFISMYTSFTTTNKHNTRLIIRRYSKVQGKEIFTLSYDDDTSLVHYQKLNFPFKSRLGYFEIVGSCHGLVCLTDAHLKQTSSPKPIILWNPLVGKSVTLPVKHANISPTCDAIIGFGFDSKNIDYKVVSIVYCPGEYGSGVVLREVEVFDLGVGSWRSIKTTVAPPPYVVTQCSPQAFLNGAIHWIGYSYPNEETGGRGKLSVAVFDVGDEAFQELEMPDEVANKGLPDHGNKITVSVIDESLSLIQYSCEWWWQPDQNYHLCYIWVMKEYGVAKSWIKQYKICPWEGFSKTLGFRRNGEILLVMNYGELVSYDPQSQRISPLEIYGDSCSFYLDTYVESLLLWKGINNVLGGPISCNAITH